MRVKSDGKPGHSIYYACRVHEIQPAALSRRVHQYELLDLYAWTGVLEKLLEPGTLEELAREQVRLDTSESPTSRLEPVDEDARQPSPEARQLGRLVGDGERCGYPYDFTCESQGTWADDRGS